ncbi:uncharacterized protein LY89DRAFT_691215 [Mollisia scopiformis]|uniref:Uncharacterized protein n=1 Tax=Mollisia scopiformis TaxID=149040 RepID=A0A132B7H8_MOLSC|nr:uncharacterized protein LY89DRAFT_691215 [Mollisia scopiformis]KUJ08366.1 hypothetical protein LY89DRAFT_691215 [Mollisia scopiformis]
MAPANNRQPAPILPPSTPSNNNSPRPSPTQQTTNNQQHETPTSTPTTETRMNPPSLPRSLMTPAREMRESSVISSAGSSARKPRQNLDEKDHMLMLKHCYEQRGNFKEGTKAQFWTGVNTAFQKDTGKVLAQMSATVGRLVESRRRQIADWENGVIPQKPGGELNDMLDQWMEFLKTEDGEAEAERMRQVDARRKVEEARKEARRQAIAAEAAAAASAPAIQPGHVPIQQQPPPAMAQMGQPPQHQYPPQQQHPQNPPPPSQYQSGEMVVANGEEQDMNGYRPHKRKRQNERALTRDLQAQIEQQQWEAQQYAMAHPPEPPRRVIVEGALTKEDWRDIMGNDARLRAIENKVDKIELIVSQNNKLLLQLVQNQSKERDRSSEEERVPVHLDAEFERDYL